MTAVATITVAGLALTASGSRAAEEMASVSKKVGSAKLVRLASFLPEPPVPPAPPEAIEAPAAPAVPEAPQRVTKQIVIVGREGESSRAELPEPPMPAVSSVPPIPPVPPVAPSARDMHQTHRIVIRNRNGTQITNIDGEDIVADISDIDVQEKCSGGEPVKTDTSVARNARVHAMEGLKQARAQMAREMSLSAETRANLLADMDGEIARLQTARD